jgi:peroxiredoxin Q/BCP
MLKVGDPAPDFTATAHTGETVSLQDLRGKHVVLWFYPKADTPGCTIEGKGFRDSAGEFESRSAVILGVSFDTVEDNCAFAEKFTFPYRLLADPERKIGLAYQAAKTADQGYADRITYLIGPDGTIKAAYDTVDVNEHPAQVLAAIA